MKDVLWKSANSTAQRYVISVLTPQLAAVHLRSWNQVSQWVSPSYLLRFGSLWWSDPLVNMLFVFSFPCCALRCLRAELSCFSHCWQRLAVQQQSALTPSNSPSLPPSSPPSPLSTPFSLPHKRPKANNYHPEQHSMYIQNLLHYVMDEDFLNTRHPE